VFRAAVRVQGVGCDAMSVAYHFARNLYPGPAGESDRVFVAVESTIFHDVHDARDEAIANVEMCA
jgi:hypothetical protein